MQYPESPRGDVVDTYHGKEVPDPYRWLEDPDSSRTRAWVGAQNGLTEDWLSEIPARAALRARLTGLWDHTRWGLPRKRGGRYFYERSDGLQDQPVLYVAGHLDATPKVLIDANRLSDDGTVALADWEPSHDGVLVAWSTSEGGSDWRTWRVRDVDSGKDLPDTLRWSKFAGVAWLPDGSGFFYCAYDPPRDPLEEVVRNQRLYLHRLGDAQKEDRLIYARPDEPEWGFVTEVTEDGELLVVFVWSSSAERNRIHVLDLTAKGASVVPLLDDYDAYYFPLGKIGRWLYFRTDHSAPLGRIVRVSLDDPHPDRWEEVVPEARETLSDASIVGNTLLLGYLRDAHSVVRRFDLHGKALDDLELPSLGTVVGLGGRIDDPETFYQFTSFTTPTSVYRYDTASGQSTLFRAPEVDFDAAAFTTEQVFYESRDGTRVPMFLVHGTDVTPDGDRPVLLYGYGGFNASLTPAYASSRAVWLEQGGVLAIANLRGGGEYGREWHEAGTLHRKQNVFDDFIAAAEWLIDNDWTRPERLAVQGRSNGGLLVGAVVQQRPDLFGAAVAGVGVMDMLRYHRFTIGWAWASDYGTADDPEMFETLLAYSPVHNARPARYPAILVVTADHDDRVVPAHSYKFTAAMQAAQQGDAPVLIRVETRAGHGAWTPTSLLIAQAADEWAFLVRALGMTVDA